VALGCVGPTHVLAPSVAKCLEGQKMTASLLGQAATQVMDVCAPIDDFRATAAYRKKMASVLTRRALENAYQQALDS
jgi:carbon-monoxide dehydrogenase medium subunit